MTTIYGEKKLLVYRVPARASTEKVIGTLHVLDVTRRSMVEGNQLNLG